MLRRPEEANGEHITRDVISPSNAHFPPLSGIRALSSLSRYHQGSDKTTREYSKIPRLPVGCTWYQRVAGEAKFPVLQRGAASGVPLNPARFSAKDESGDLTDEDIFRSLLPVVICGRKGLRRK